MATGGLLRGKRTRDEQAALGTILFNGGDDLIVVGFNRAIQAERKARVVGGIGVLGEPGADMLASQQMFPAVVGEGDIYRVKQGQHDKNGKGGQSGQEVARGAGVGRNIHPGDKGRDGQQGRSQDRGTAVSHASGQNNGPGQQQAPHNPVEHTRRHQGPRKIRSRALSSAACGVARSEVMVERADSMALQKTPIWGMPGMSIPASMLAMDPAMSGSEERAV